MKPIWVGIMIIAGAALSMGQVAVSSKGDTVLSSKLAGADVRVKIRTHELANGTPSEPMRPPDSSCTMSRFPCSPVDSIEIMVGGKEIFVPRSAFADLADVNQAELSIEKSNLVLKLIGADASESYIVKIKFTPSHVTYRSLTSGEFPERPLQETVYRLD
jgi:hypothetical protein